MLAMHFVSQKHFKEASLRLTGMMAKGNTEFTHSEGIVTWIKYINSECNNIQRHGFKLRYSKLKDKLNKAYLV